MELTKTIIQFLTMYFATLGKRLALQEIGR